MTTGSDDALDVALGLLRAPALRGELRTRPLPAGMGELLGIASGSTDRAHAAAARTGHAQGELLEASRFYVQQVLLAEGADAYRVLGVARGADHAAIRDHHRLLLRWLHPDRNEGAQWESAFATRVNAAWTQLRSSEAISDYDARLDAAVGQGAGQGSRPSPSGGLRAPARSLRLDGDAPESRAGPFAVAGLGLACIALAWLAVQREGELDRLRDAASNVVSGVAADVATPAQMPTHPESQEQAPTPSQAALSQRVASARRAPPPPPTVARVVEPPRATPAVADVRDVRPQAAPPQVPAPTAAAPPPIRRATPAPQDTSASSIAHAAASSRIGVPEQSPPPPSSPSTAAPNAPAPALQSSSAPSDPLQLMHEAEATVGALTAYLTQADAPSPAFLDPTVRLEALGARSRLHARLDARQRRDMEIQAPAWTLDDRHAALLGAYRIRGTRGTQETGLLRLQLARHDDAWRVSELQLEPAR